ncbi:winged helix-turn-helix domain-containing protein [Roseomonas sp. CCTCC AB2023176]|uniref:winged helix-turn-helix domain-containing protein n=1 Tax=Roseomonas sp. CCTCC AB2023176 TaxID=3342640 RepID=UPI0035E027B7
MPDGFGFRSIVIPCGRYRLDLSRRSLTDPAGKPVALRPKTFDVLHALLLRADRVVSREELLDAVWRNVHVTDDSITHCIAEIRRALGPAPGVVVRTVPRHGYMLETDAANGQPAAPAALSIAVTSFVELGDLAPRSLGIAVAEDVAIGLAKRDGVRVLMPDAERGDAVARSADRILTGTVRRAGGPPRHRAAGGAAVRRAPLGRVL